MTSLVVFVLGGGKDKGLKECWPCHCMDLPRVRSPEETAGVRVCARVFVGMSCREGV